MMYFRKTLTYSLITGLLLISCRDAQKETGLRTYALEQVGSTMIVQVYADGFNDLTLPEMVTAYYLYRAAVAGRDITYDQHHKHALEIRNILDGISSHPEGIETEVYNKILDYTKLFWANNGMYNNRTREKFVPEVDFETFAEAAKTAQENGADIGLKSGESIDEKLQALRAAIFDAEFEPLLANKSPKPGEDVLETSANNLYEGVTANEARVFQDIAKNPLNSKLIKQGGQLIELVYRAGGGGIPPGMYANELLNIIGEFENAMPFTTEAQKKTMSELVTYFHTGDLNDFRNYNIAWLQDDPVVDFINGFIEVYLDVLGQKGEYEGGVFFVDNENTQLMKDLAENAQYFEERMPWDDMYKQSKPEVPVANSINLVAGTGGLGPMSPIGINLPNEQALRETYGSKSVLLSNITAAVSEAVGPKGVNEFALPEEREPAIQYGEAYRRAEVAMHEVIGHGSGKVNPDLLDDPATLLGDYYSAMEETRAELIALYHMFDPKLIEMGMLTNREAAEAAYRAYARGDMVQLRRITTGEVITDDHMKASHLIVQYLMRKTRVVEKVNVDGKSYYKVTDIDGMRQGIAELLSEVMRIKGEGDYDAIKVLIDTYGTKIDTGLRDEVIARCEAINYPSYYAFCFPELEAVRNTSGDIIDVKVTIPESFTAQQLRFAEMFGR